LLLAVAVADQLTQLTMVLAEEREVTEKVKTPVTLIVQMVALLLI
jgi:hypothetical protein